MENDLVEDFMKSDYKMAEYHPDYGLQEVTNMDYDWLKIVHKQDCDVDGKYAEDINGCQYMNKYYGSKDKISSTFIKQIVLVKNNKNGK
jgi:hypothetical protein